MNTEQIPMLNSHTVGAIRAGVNDTEERRAAIALSDELIAELKAADYIAKAISTISAAPVLPSAIPKTAPKACCPMCRCMPLSPAAAPMRARNTTK